VPMPANVVSLVERTWASTIKGPDGSPAWTAAQ
jgi:hypothetical protein